MKKVLFLPFLQIPSGHHQAAEAIITELKHHFKDIHCEKVDLFSYSYGKLESFVSQFYLKWIHHFPISYSKLYKFMVAPNTADKEAKYLYERFFEKQLERLLYETKPDCIICTHALPSRIISKLKQDGKTEIPVYNVYTDFFIHKGWGIQHIDGHFISTWKMKNYLLSKNVNGNHIYFTGIPIHPILKKRPLIPEHPRLKANILISGGSMGTGNLYELIENLSDQRHLHFFILCGKNQLLYNQLVKRNMQHITPIPYIHSRKMMDLLYNQADLIVTKPGGVTISECIHKKVPIFVYDKLPGQEEINFDELRVLQLIEESRKWKRKGGLSEEIMDFLYNPRRLSQYFHSFHRYEGFKHEVTPSQIIMNKMVK